MGSCLNRSALGPTLSPGQPPAGLNVSASQGRSPSLPSEPPCTERVLSDGPRNGHNCAVSRGCGNTEHGAKPTSQHPSSWRPAPALGLSPASATSSQVSEPRCRSKERSVRSRPSFQQFHPCKPHSDSRARSSCLRSGPQPRPSHRQGERISERHSDQTTSTAQHTVERGHVLQRGRTSKTQRLGDGSHQTPAVYVSCDRTYRNVRNSEPR